MTRDIHGPVATAAGRARLVWRHCVVEALPGAWRTVRLLLRIMIPVSFAVFLLKAAGGLDLLARVLAPLFSGLGLPGSSALVFITGGLLNIYAAIGVIETLGLGGRTVTILALMTLTAHNLPVECSVVGRAGSNPWRILALRLGFSLVAALALNALLPLDAVAPAAAASAPSVADVGGFSTDLGRWALGMGRLSLKILLIIFGLMIAQRLLDTAGITRGLARALKYPLIILGVPPEAAFLWVVANTLGLAYGAGVIIDHAQRGLISRAHADRLNHHISISHSLLEDTLLYTAIGVPALWITLPRLALAGIASRLRPLTEVPAGRDHP